MTDSKLIDSSIWLEYLFNGKYKEILEKDEVLLLSVISLFEIEKKLHKEKIELKKIMESMEFIRLKSLVINMNPEIAEKAIGISLKYNLATVDAIIYATAVKQQATLISIDNDFRGLPNVMVLKKKE